MKHKMLALLCIVALWPSTIVLAQGGNPGDLNVAEFIGTVIYGVVGIFLCILGYFTFDKLAGLDLQRELVEDQNVSLGIMLAGVFIGIAMVVSAAIAG